jgi:zinc protease
MAKKNYMKLSRLLVLLSVIVSALPLFGQAPAASTPQVTEFDVNGMKVLIKRRQGAPTVAAGLFFRGGVRNVEPQNAGIENFALSVAAEGSKSFPTQKLRKETSRVGTVISAGSNYDFSVIALASTKGNFDSSWQMFTDVALNPSFDPENVERIRSNILTALRSSNDSPEGALEMQRRKIVFADHPYSNEPEGTVESITRIKTADLAAYHRRMMETSRLLLVVVGDVDSTELQKKITATFGSLPRGDYKPAAVSQLVFGKPTVDVTPRTVQTNYVKGIFAAPSIADPDYYAMRVAISMLQQAVFQEVRVKRNLSYAPDAELDDHAANTASISVSSVNPNEAIKVMLGEIKRLREGGIPEDALGQMSGYFLTTYFLKQETNAAQVAELAQYELMGGGWRNSLGFLDRMRKVKPAEIQAVANKYMKNIRFVVVGNPSDIDRTIFLQNTE